MKYLLDTHIWLWSLLDPNKISSQVQEILRNDANELYISPITVWETLTLAEKGRIELNPSPEEWILEALQRSPVVEAPLSHAVAIKSKSITLPDHVPADRFIAATAWEYGFTLITADHRLRQAKEIATA